MAIKVLMILFGWYVVMDIVIGLVVYWWLQDNGWTRAELAEKFQRLIKMKREDFLNEIVNERLMGQEEFDTNEVDYDWTEGKDYDDYDWPDN